MKLWTAMMFLLGPTLGLAQPVETEVLFAGSGAEQWDTARSRARLEQEFSSSELGQAESDGQAVLTWRFVSRGVGFNDIFLRRPVERFFDLLRFRVRNLGAPVTLACKVADASRAEWTANQVKLTAQQGWQWLEFPRSEWHVASWSSDRDGKLDFPLAYVTLIAFEVEPGREYHVEVERLELVRPEPPVADVSALRCPRSANAGETVQVSLSFSLDRPCRESDASVAFRLDGSDRFSSALSLARPLTELAVGERVDAAAEARIPQYAHGGSYAVVLRLGEARARRQGKIVGDEGVQAMTVRARKPGKSTAAVKLHRGTPTLFINGRPHNGMAYTAYSPSVEVFADFARAGVDLFSFSATPTEAGYGLSRTTWTAPDTYDYTQLDERVMMVLEANPEAYIFPRLYLHAPKWWSEKHPDDVVRADPGDGKPVRFIHHGAKPAPCWVSEAWRRDTIEGLRRLIAYVEASPYADRVIGYHLASGTTEEWMMWGANEREWVGYSPVNVRCFRDWLRARYGTEAALRRSWGDPDVTFGTAQVPLRAIREHTAFGSLRRPAAEQAVIDFYLYNSHMVADTICVLAKVVKESTHREKAVGVFYGYLLQLCGEQRQQNAGHLALGEVLASPDVDFLCSPTSYRFRQLGGEGTSHFMSLHDSVKLHGKLWFDENDIRTSLAPGKVGGWGKPETVAGDVLQQDKELANVLVNGAAQWWFDVGRNRYDDRELMKRIGELTADATRTLALSRGPVDEIALVVDEKSLCYLKVGDPLGRELLIEQLPALHRVGAPVGHYLASDLGRLVDHRVLVLSTSIAPDAAQRRAVERLKSDGRVLVFCYAPGLYRDGQLDAAAMAEFCGIRLGLVEEPMGLRTTLRAGHKLTDGMDGVEYGPVPDREIAPFAVADDPKAVVLGTLADGRPGLVVRQFAAWTAVFSTAPLLPRDLLRNLAEFAGVHLYVDTPDVVWACEDMLAICVNEPGTRRVRLPGRRTVTDLYRDERVAVQDAGMFAVEFETDFEARSTRVFTLK